MRVVLLDPPNRCLQGPGQTVHVHPLGLGYVAGALGTDHDVLQIVPDVRDHGSDDYGSGDPFEVVVAAACGFRPDLVGIGAASATLPSALRLAAGCRSRLGADVPIVVGGVHATIAPEDVLADPCVDFAVVGEGERALPALARALERGEAVDTIAGLVRRDGARLLRGPPPATEPDLDVLPFPDRERILWAEHVPPSFYQSIVTARGCPYACIYCAAGALSRAAGDERRVRYRSASNVAGEVELLRRRHGADFLFFHDSVFTLDRRRTVRLLDELLGRDIATPFSCQTRADRLDDELLALMRRAGCVQILLGIESGDAETLARIGKAVPLEKTRQAVEMVKRHDIRAGGFFMVGFPWEGEDHVRRTASFATSLGLHSVSLFSATPLPGTRLWQMAGPATRHGHESLRAGDFRRPERNLTSMSDDRYARLYGEVEALFAAYNESAPAPRSRETGSRATDAAPTKEATGPKAVAPGGARGQS